MLTEDWFFLSHFLPRALAAVDAGYEVTVLARENGRGQDIRKAGLDFVPINLRRTSLNPLGDIAALLAIRNTYRGLRPTIVHHVGLKPILLGTLAAKMLGIRSIVNAPVGMGYLFTSKQIAASLFRPLAKLGLRVLLNPRGSRVIVENRDDLEELASGALARRQELVLIRGAGVDMAHYPIADPRKDAPVIVTLVARMLWSKGVGEFVEAARLLKANGVDATFRLVGGPDPDNPQTVPESTLRQWHDSGAVQWLGHREDVPAILAESQIGCLPSYREGLPKSLLEAMAAGLPIVTTDVPGCREVVAEGQNGLLVPAQDARGLADALDRLIADADLRVRLGSAGRRRAAEEFASPIIIDQTLQAYSDARRA